jgi:hypothetical protein
MITKGPWKREGWEIIGGDGAIIAKLLPWDSSGCRGEDNDNADLIAKAPQTLCRLAEVEKERDALKAAAKPFVIWGQQCRNSYRQMWGERFRTSMIFAYRLNHDQSSISFDQLDELARLCGEG